MELKVKEVTLPEMIEFNYQELKNELEEKVSVYSALVYTDEQIKEAKADRANLNKLKKALNDERIRREKEYMEPFNDFKAKINEIIGIIDKPVAVIDKQVKEYEEKQKQEKKEAILEMWNAMEHPEALTFEKVFMDRFLNTSTSMKVVEQCLADSITKYNNDLATLSNLPEFGFEAVEVYKSTLDINKAISEAKRMSEIAKAKAEREAAEKARAEEQERLEAEKKVAEMEPVKEAFPRDAMNPPVEEVPETPTIPPLPMWVGFKALLTTEQAMELKKFFDDRNIQFKSI